MNIFISYAREDAESANRLYQDLSSIPGVTPWLDSKKLLPGVRWKMEIMEALNTCDLFIILLSSNSVSKYGFIQKEINEALEKLKTIPPDKIFVIPARLDDCHPKHLELNELQWVDLFPDWEIGYSLIVKSILNQTKLPQDPPVPEKNIVIETITSSSDFMERLKARGEMRGADAMELVFQNQSFEGTNLSGANFVRCKFLSCNFKNTILKGVNFEGANFGDCHFAGADLWGVNFWGADVRGISDLNEALFNHTNFWNTKLPQEHINLIKSHSKVVHLGDYDSFLIHFISTVRMSEEEISKTFIWFNHRYFKLMYRKNDDTAFLIRALSELLQKSDEE